MAGHVKELADHRHAAIRAACVCDASSGHVSSAAVRSGKVRDAHRYTGAREETILPLPQIIEIRGLSLAFAPDRRFHPFRFRALVDEDSRDPGVSRLSGVHRYQWHPSRSYAKIVP